MGSKAIIFLCLTALVLMMIASEVSARDLPEAETTTHGVEESKYDGGYGGGGGKGRGGGRGGGGGYGRHCGCCGRYHCHCCSAADQAAATIPESKPQN